MVSEKPALLIVDDEQVVCDVLSDELSEQGYLCSVALNGNEALAKLMIQHFKVVLLDMRLPGMSGVEVLRKIRLNHRDTATIMITVVNDVDTAVEVMKLGASDYIVKPFDLDRVSTSIRTALRAGDRLSERRDCQTQDEQATEEFLSQMDAIAYGVEARLDSLFGYSKRVIKETTNIAWQFGIPGEEIRRWAAGRLGHDTKKNEAIKSSLNKLERSPLAQKIMGLLVPYRCIPKPDEPQN